MSDPNRPGPPVPTTASRRDDAFRRPSGQGGRRDDPAGTQAAPPGHAPRLSDRDVAVSSATAGSLAPDAARGPARVTVARRGPRRARLVVKHVDPWTVMKVTFVVTLVILVVVVIAAAIIYAVLGKMGVWDQINSLVNQVSPTTAPKSLHNPLTGSRVIGITAVVGAVNVVLMTALATLGAAIYNLISDLVGGVEVTLSDP